MNSTPVVGELWHFCSNLPESEAVFLLMRYQSYHPSLEEHIFFAHNLTRDVPATITIHNNNRQYWRNLS